MYELQFDSCAHAGRLAIANMSLSQATGDKIYTLFVDLGINEEDARNYETRTLGENIFTVDEVLQLSDDDLKELGIKMGIGKRSLRVKNTTRLWTSCLLAILPSTRMEPSVT